MKGASGDSNGSRLHPEKLKRGKSHHAYLKPECYQRGEAAYMAKLKTVQVIEIRRRHGKGNISYAQLAREFGVEPETISAVVRRKTWTNVP
jgi:hypothetical protein